MMTLGKASVVDTGSKATGKQVEAAALRVVEAVKTVQTLLETRPVRDPSLVPFAVGFLDSAAELEVSATKMSEASRHSTETLALALVLAAEVEAMADSPG